MKVKRMGSQLGFLKILVISCSNGGFQSCFHLNYWTGQIGQTIRVKAQDDTHVAKVHVEINDANGTLLEQGDAVPAEGLWWTYTTTTVISSPSASIIMATAEDLPGNKAELMWQYN